LDGSPRTLPTGADEAGGTAVKFYKLRDNLLHETVPVIAQAAYYANGDLMVEQMAVFADRQGANFPRGAFLDAMEQILRAAPAGSSTETLEPPVNAAHIVLDLEPPDFDED